MACIGQSGVHKVLPSDMQYATMMSVCIYIYNVYNDKNNNKNDNNHSKNIINNSNNIIVVVNNSETVNSY